MSDLRRKLLLQALKSQGESQLSVKEHEYLTMGLLWQTLLITECKGRHDAIQEQLAAIDVFIKPLLSPRDVALRVSYGYDVQQ